MIPKRKAQQLRELIDQGLNQIGEIWIQTNVHNHRYVISHRLDLNRIELPNPNGLTVHSTSIDAREIATYAEDGTYRFTKVQLNLRRGWVMFLETDEDLRLALDGFYPACTGLFQAWREGSLEVEPLREKLARQTGMYRYTHTISDAGAQKVVRQVCGPANRCARKILWPIDAETPLEDSEASRYQGLPVGCTTGIPLLCREACNHFVAECRKEAQAEAKARASEPAN